MGYSRHKLDKGDYIGITAFVGVVLGSFGMFSFYDRIGGTETQLILTFVLGGLFAFIGILSNRFIDHGSKFDKSIYFVVQAAIGLSCIWISPAKGYFGILCLPLASQTVFLFRWQIALACGVFLYVATAMVFYPESGWSGVREGMVSYSTAYIFTVGFTYVTHDAVSGRLKSAALATELQAANEQLRAQATQTEELATTRERNRLAREIHDGVGHYLTVINVQAEAAQALLETEPGRANEALEKIAGLSRDALADVRRSVGSLRAEDQRPPLVETLRDLAKNAAVPIDFKIVGEPRSLSSAAEHTLFRAAQEGITNISKHANATQSWLELDFTAADRAKLKLKDNGQGPGQSETSGFGICGMRERVDLLGGSVTSGKRDEGGFQINVEVPA